MQTFKDFILESQQIYKSNVPSNIYKLCEQLVRHLNYSALKKFSEQDPNRFDISKANEAVFIESFKMANTEYQALSTQDYYASITDKTKWENLSIKEKADFDTQYGDIIIVNKDNKVICYIDIKISDKYFGTVSLGSLVNFKEDGVYICINKQQKQYRIVSHKDLVQVVKDNPDILKAPVEGKSYKGYSVDWEGEKLTSEYFVQGKEIAKFS